ncbi:MAG: hypothetical protein SGARI_002597, partial [Bacillariaceae sp.]
MENTVIISETEAKRRLALWNFNPENVTEESALWHDADARKENAKIIDYDKRLSRPLIIFSQLGDISMIQYILSQVDDEKKAELAKTDEHGLFPLYVAIARGRTQEEVLSVCKLLLKQGANLFQLLGDDDEY